MDWEYWYLHCLFFVLFCFQKEHKMYALTDALGKQVCILIYIITALGANKNNTYLRSETLLFSLLHPRLLPYTIQIKK